MGNTVLQRLLYLLYSIWSNLFSPRRSCKHLWNHDVRRWPWRRRCTWRCRSPRSSSRPRRAGRSHTCRSCSNGGRRWSCRSPGRSWSRWQGSGLPLSLPLGAHPCQSSPDRWLHVRVFVEFSANNANMIAGKPRTIVISNTNNTVILSGKVGDVFGNNNKNEAAGGLRVMSICRVWWGEYLIWLVFLAQSTVQTVCLNYKLKGKIYQLEQLILMRRGRSRSSISSSVIRTMAQQQSFHAHLALV